MRTLALFTLTPYLLSILFHACRSHVSAADNASRQLLMIASNLASHFSADFIADWGTITASLAGGVRSLESAHDYTQQSSAAAKSPSSSPSQRASAGGGLEELDLEGAPSGGTAHNGGEG
ncbi:hypothetical protein VaNZ11_006590, partial [Volvox africanus]